MSSVSKSLEQSGPVAHLGEGVELIVVGVCKHKVSGSVSLPSRGPFHLSLTVLFAIGHWVVFRLGGWAPRLQTGFHVSCPTLVSPWFYHLFAYGDFTLSVATFQSSSAKMIFYRIGDPQPRQ